MYVFGLVHFAYANSFVYFKKSSSHVQKRTRSKRRRNKTTQMQGIQQQQQYNYTNIMRQTITNKYYFSMIFN